MGMRKGSVIYDVIFILLGFFSSVVFVMVAGLLAQEFMDVGVFNLGFVSQAYDAVNLFNYLIVGVVGFFYLVSGMLAFRIRTSPVFALPAIVFNGVATFLAAEFSNVLYMFVSLDSFVSVANDFPALVGLIEFLPLVVGGLNFLLIVVNYVLPRESVRQPR